jgi:hypothetical protein
MKKVILLAVPLLIVAGCASAPSPSRLSHLDYGPKPMEYEVTVRQYFNSVLIDPQSAYYNIEAPQKFWYNDTCLFSSQLYSGYLVRVGVNSKNKFGGYMVEKQYGFIIKNGRIVKVLHEGEMMCRGLLYGT